MKITNANHGYKAGETVYIDPAFFKPNWRTRLWRWLARYVKWRSVSKRANEFVISEVTSHSFTIEDRNE